MSSALLKHLTLLITLLWIQGSAIAAHSPDDHQAVDLKSGHYQPDIWYLEDSDHTIDINQARDLYRQGQFKKTAPNFNFGYSQSDFWIHFHLQLKKPDSAVSYHDILLEFKYPHIDQVQLYREEQDGSIVAFPPFGDNLPHKDRFIDNNMFVFADKVSVDNSHGYWLKLSTTSANQLHLSIWDKDRYLERHGHSQLAYGIYFGILIIMAIYNLFIGYSIKDKSYFYYVAYISAFGLLQGCLQGYSFQYLWPNNPEINNFAIQTFILGSIVFACLFAQSFLQTKKFSPTHHKILSGLVIYGTSFIILQPLFSYEQRIVIAVWGSLFATVSLLSAAVSMYLNGHRFAQLFLMAWTILLVGAVIYGFASLGFFPINLFTRHAAQIGSAIEIVLLSFALADRINRMKAEKRAIEKQAKDTLEQKNLELENTLALLQKSNSLKDEFLATISHELRTPMNGIEGSLQIVQDNLKDQPVSQHLHAAYHSAHHMTQLVESLLEYSELQSGNWKLNIQPFNLENLVEDSTRHIKGEYATSDVSFKLSGQFQAEHLLVGDGDRIQHLIFQLLDNAFKFTHEGTVSLDIHAREIDDHYRLNIEVADSGIGINPSQLKEIFEGFRQVDGSFSRQYGGLGIGLSLCKAITDKMNGTIAVESIPNQGTRFTIEVDLPKGAKIEVKQENVGKLPGNPKILVVEDNPVNQMTLVAMMKKLGCQVDKANNGEEAVRMATEKEYDCILMDCQMPIMDGFDATKVIRTLENQNAGIPIIAVTANAMSGDKDRCIDAGMNDYIRKPIKKDVIAERLFHWLIDKAA